jgi:type IV pilus biogenesis protein CpaD/CtpE
MKIVCYAVLIAAALLAAPTFAQSKPTAPQPAAAQTADTMQILREKMKGDKKLLVAANMGLTAAEAKGFWPLYEEYQKELHQVNDRLAMVIVTYANEYNANSLTDEKAQALLDRYLGIEEAEIKLKRSFVPRLGKVLPGRKVARYMQLENKIRAVVKYEIAGEVPLSR